MIYSLKHVFYFHISAVDRWPSELREADVPIYSNAECREQGYTGENVFICAGGVDTTGVCYVSIHHFKIEIYKILHYTQRGFSSFKCPVR